MIKMAEAPDLTDVKSGLNDKDVQKMQDFLEENDVVTQTRKNDLDNMKDLRTIDIKSPVANGYTKSLQPFQLVDKLANKIRRPSATYKVQGGDQVVAQVIRDGVKTVQEAGGYMTSLSGKPSAIAESLNYGDGFIRQGLDKDGEIMWDNVQPDKVYVDANATVLHGKNKNRKPTRLAVIYSYDHAEGQSQSSVKIGLGEIPKTRQNFQDFDKTDEQESKGREKKVETIHYFDIGGKKPIYIQAWGTDLTIDKKNKGKD